MVFGKTVMNQNTMKLHDHCSRDAIVKL